MLETAKKIRADQFFYVGDLPDDMLAAQSAKSQIPIRSIAFPLLAKKSKLALAEMEKVRPDFILKKPEDLLKIIVIPAPAKIRGGSDTLYGGKAGI